MTDRIDAESLDIAPAGIAPLTLEEEVVILRQMLQHLPEAVSLVDANGIMRITTDKFVAVQRSTRAELASFRTFEERIRWQLETGRAKMLAPTIEETIALVAERRGRTDSPPVVSQRRDGIWSEHSFVGLPHGRVMVIFRDVSDLKRREIEAEAARDVAEAARRETEATQSLLRIVLDNLTDGVGLIEADGRNIVVNQAMSDLNGFANGVFDIGRNVRDTFRWQLDHRHTVPPDGMTIDQGVDWAWQQFQHADAQPVTRQRPNGKWLERRFIALADGRRLIIHRDVTRLKQDAAEIQLAREAAERERDAAHAANQAKSTFLATMSHEIRTPMNGVLGMMEVLEHQNLTEDQRGIVATMRDSATSLLRIIDDVLDFSKIEAGRMELEETRFSLSDLIGATLATLRAQAAAKRLRLVTDIDPGSADLLIGDPGRVRQILFNLVGNAIKFTQAGTVRVRAETAPLGGGGAEVMLSVSDTGIGMDAEQQRRLFQPFVQADNSTTRQYGGSGLGLSIVRRLTQLMGGDVSVESSLGEGSTFTATLVLAAAQGAGPPPRRPGASPADAAPPSAAPAVVSPRRFDRQTVLVVDDHPVNRDVMMRQLDLLGLDAETADDGMDGLARWRAGHHAVVLADIHMPRMDGYDLARAIRADPAGARVPIVAVTANALKDEAERCRQAGMDAYLTKPVSLVQLGETLRRWLALGEIQAISGSVGAFDATALDAWLGNDPAAVAQTLATFRNSARTTLDALAAALDRNALAAAQASAHRLAGAAAAVGAHRMASAAARLQLAAVGGERERCWEALAALHEEFVHITHESSARRLDGIDQQGRV